jgi:CRP-like cAMP-binding protein
MPHPALEAPADEDCQLVEVRHERWLRDLAASAAAVREFVMRTCVRFAQADRRLIMMARRSADERIGLLLLEQASADRQDVPRGCGKVTHTRAEIAQAAAMTRPHVTVTLGRFRRKGLIRYRAPHYFGPCQRHANTVSVRRSPLAATGAARMTRCTRRSSPSDHA